ncbi:hypothetical protein LOK49_Contig1G00015 [Camellia lanceoleosa]|nr:hypothetical protein LOK49_Contig1G00015 [Camellia lanceoleosa]
MGVLGSIAIVVSSFVCLYLFLVLIKLFHKLWLNPIHVQRVLASQGIRGPAYKFIHGNTKEMLMMRTESMSRPMDLSHQIFARLQPHLHSWLKIYGKNFLTWNGPKAQLVITESEFAKEILKNKEKAYLQMETEGYLKKLLGDSLVTSEGEKWSKLRKLANHALHAESLKNMVPAMVSSVEMMLERWKQHEGEEIEVFEEFRILTSEVISRTTFGSSYLEGKDIFEMLTKLGIITSRNPRRPIPDTYRSILPIPILRDRYRYVTRYRDLKLWDLLGLLVKASNDADENKRITVENVVDECKAFYIAGHETTTTLLAWSVLLLAIHTDWQEEARKEVLELFGQQDPNAEGIPRMKKMNMIINESLRLYSPIINITRKVQRKVKLGQFILPANINVTILTLALHLDPQIWGDDVYLFKPERFSEGVAKATNNNPAVYLPFGFGQRSCVGTSFAINETKIALSMILQRYAFTLSPTYSHSPVQVLTVRPQRGIQVKLHAL